jgi:alpha-glucosidase
VPQHRSGPPTNSPEEPENKAGTLPRAYYAALPFTRLLAGHADFTPCTFDPAMLKGATVSLQLATAILYTSPLQHWADDPRWYQASPARDLISAVPSTWDETVVLPGSVIGELAGMARRSGDDWFIALINGGDEARHHRIELAFLPAGRYRATLVRDILDDPTRMQVERQHDLAPGHALETVLAPGGGFVAHFIRS